MYRCTALYSNILLCLLYSQYPGAFAFRGSLLLVTLIKRLSALVITTEIVKVLDLVNSYDPILTGKGLLNSAKFGTFARQPRTTNSVLGLPGREERVVVVVRHLVPSTIVSSCSR